MHGQNRIKFMIMIIKIRLPKNMDGRSPSGHDNEESRTRSVETQRGMAFGFRKTAAAVIKPDG